MVGGGLYYPYTRECQRGKLFVEMIDSIEFPSFSTWQCQHGLFQIYAAEPLMSMFSVCPPGNEYSEIEENNWIWGIYNHMLSPELQQLWGYIYPAELCEIPSAFILKVTCVLEGHVVNALIKSSVYTLKKILSSKGWYNSPQSVMQSLNMQVPIKVSSLRLTMRTLLMMECGDLIIPGVNNFNPGGCGTLNFGALTLEGEIKSYGENTICFVIKEMGVMESNKSMNQDEVNEIIHDFNDIEDNHIVIDDKDNDIGQYNNEVQDLRQREYASLSLDLHIQCGNVIVTLNDLEHLSVGSTLLTDNLQPGQAKLCYQRNVIAHGELVDVAGRLGFLVSRVISISGSELVEKMP